MTAQAILEELRPLGRDSYKKVMLNHGVTEPLFGVKIEELKKIQKRIKRDYQLALELYDTGNYDAMYLAGLIADDARMTKADLRRWVKQAARGALATHTVPAVAAGGAHGRELAREWIESGQDFVAGAGWWTWVHLVSITPDAALDLGELQRLLQRVRQSIREAGNDTRYAMNQFVIAAGSFVPALTELALRLGEEIGPVQVDMGNTACQVPFAPDYIRKVEKRGTLGKKRKSAKC